MKFTEPELIERLRENSEPELQRRAVCDDWRHAAVLVPLVFVDQRWNLLFIRRADVPGDVHSGQVGFPGGRVESGEDAVSAALREAVEEIGLATKDVNVVRELKDFYSVSNYRVTPVVAISVWPYRFVLQRSEVSRVFIIPLEWLAEPGNYQQKKLSASYGTDKVIHYTEYDGEILWGLSANIVHSVLSLLGPAQ